MSADRLEAALREAGIACRVEARDRLAILSAAAGTRAETASEWRPTAVRLAREHGFTHTALELTDEINVVGPH